MKDDQDDPINRQPDSDAVAPTEHPAGRPRMTKSATRQRRFESALDEIEAIVTKLERGELDLGESLTQYQRGIETLKECHQLLSDAERRITLLSGFDADGNPVTTCFDETDMTLDEKQSKRGNRRTAERKANRPADDEEPGGSGEIAAGLF
jgi:exodeoxyribonuclease VII small subunit